MTFPAPSAQMADADEQSTSKFRVLTWAHNDKNEVTIRVDRVKGTGRPLYETLVLTYDEAEALRIGLANQLD